MKTLLDKSYKDEGTVERHIDPSVTPIFPRRNINLSELEYLTDNNIENLFLRDNRVLRGNRSRVFRPIGIQFYNGHIDGIKTPTTISKVTKKYNFKNPDFVADFYEFLYRKGYTDFNGVRDRKPLTEKDFTNAKNFLTEEDFLLEENNNKRLLTFQQYLKEVPLEKLVFRSNIIHGDALLKILKKMEVDYNTLTRGAIPSYAYRKEFRDRLYKTENGSIRKFREFVSQFRKYIGENQIPYLDLDGVQQTLRVAYDKITSEIK